MNWPTEVSLVLAIILVALSFVSVNETLSLLHKSSHTRGLPHRVVNHLSVLAQSEYQRSWNSRLPPNSPQLRIIPKDLREAKREFNKLMRRHRLDRMDENAWGALGEVIYMAEGMGGLMLGRTPNERRARLSKAEISLAIFLSETIYNCMWFALTLLWF